MGFFSKTINNIINRTVGKTVENKAVNAINKKLGNDDNPTIQYGAQQPVYPAAQAAQPVQPADVEVEATAMTDEEYNARAKAEDARAQAQAQAIMGGLYGNIINSAMSAQQNSKVCKSCKQIVAVNATACPVCGASEFMSLAQASEENN